MASILNYAEYIHFSFVIYCQPLASFRRFDFDPKWLEGFIRYSFNNSAFQRIINIQANTFILLSSKNLHFSNGVNPWFWWKIQNVFPAYFSVLKTSFLSPDNVEAF